MVVVFATAAAAAGVNTFGLVPAKAPPEVAPALTVTSLAACSGHAPARRMAAAMPNGRRRAGVFMEWWGDWDF